MKKLLSIITVALLALAVVGCKKEPAYDYAKKSEGVMTYAEYAACAADGKTKVTIEGYVQAAQSYWNGATLYLQDPDGAYFVYSAPITEEDYAKLVTSTDFKNGWTGIANGTKLRVTGYKSAWEGEVEILDVEEIVIVDDVKWIAEAKDATADFADLSKYANQKVTLKGLTVTKAVELVEGKQNQDLYFDVTDGTTTYTFCVESYLCYEGSEVYQTVLGLKAGDKIDTEGFVYWYVNAQLHTTACVVK